MIINALYQHYKTLLDDPDSGISPPGFSRGRVSHCLVIDCEGKLVNIIDLRDTREGKLISREMDVPEQKKRASGISANFMCDNCVYVLGLRRSEKEKKHRIEECFRQFVQLHENVLENVEDEGVAALLLFLQSWDNASAETHPVVSRYLKDLAEGGNLVFKLEGADGYLHERDAIVEAWHRHRESQTSEVRAQCLVTGQAARVAQLHPSIKGVTGAQSTGASLVSFNLEAFTSYGKTQSFNAPVSEEVAFAYTTALNYLLNSAKHRIRVGDTTVVFWAERSTGGLEEDLLGALFFPDIEIEEDAGPKKGDSDRLVRDPQTVILLRDIFERIKTGQPVADGLVGINKETRFYILGLAPNAARLAVRFWHADLYVKFINRIGQHYSDMVIIKEYDRQPDFLSVTKILKETAPLKDTKRIAPLLGGALMRSILTGAPYPMTLYNSMLSRIRADQDVNYTRVAVIKACLVRNRRFYNKESEVDISMALNEENRNTGYLLGRLFALLEKAQVDANPGINATIRDRYFGAASASPGSVFPILLRLVQHHIAKAEYGRLIDKRIEEVISLIDSFPAYLNLEDQGRFVLGYYQQRQALYTKSEKREDAQ